MTNFICCGRYFFVINVFCDKYFLVVIFFVINIANCSCLASFLVGFHFPLVHFYFTHFSFDLLNGERNWKCIQASSFQARWNREERKNHCEKRGGELLESKSHQRRQVLNFHWPGLENHNERNHGHGSLCQLQVLHVNF